MNQWGNLKPDQSQEKPKNLIIRNFILKNIKEHDWTCSICLTHNEPNPYCKKCLPEEHQKHEEWKGIKDTKQ